MTNSQRLDCVRSQLQRWLSENVTPNRGQSQSNACENVLDLDDSSAVSIQGESILIRDGFYAGRTFKGSAAGQPFRATWFMEQDELKIHSGNGELMVCLSGDQIRNPIDVDVDVDSSVQDHPTISIPISTAIPADPSKQGHDDEGQVTKAA